MQTEFQAPVEAAELQLAKAIAPISPKAVNPLSLDLTDDLLERDRANLLQAIDNSIRYIRTPSAERRYPVAGISRDRMERSLVRFRRLVQVSRSAKDLQQAVNREFDLYRSVGRDGTGAVQFTGYYEAVYKASRTRTDEFKYPLYRLPSDFDQWRSPHPTRAMLEGSKQLAGLEIAWLSDRFQAFLVHVQGSARFELPDGNLLTVGYAGKTDQPYRSVGAELVRDGKMRLEDVTLQTLIAYFQKNPQDLNIYLNRNPSFVFFRETNGQSATGSIGVPVTAERSIATDKKIFPSGGIGLIRTEIPFENPQTGKLELRPVQRFMLDQDTGGAIRGAGRVDIFMGTGDRAKQRAGLIKGDGELYYLVLK
ncbi:MAG: MltA domain-containing protein [Pseudanabaena sp. M090S1SP1A06QC]|nr:MltA domain-containing protein [Pseudanabaena sp. M051S1SP1A06QC]MCA6587952.1 MltA domain-containing protein [Pseudanabaena sp. M109S1SP1A06QC]MCA6604956.1 MltA domain-containing protein [Pseudanabaena sp. M007S1SP1A06QC]MCA6614590.1 MltA domain-containing protein [Pseudanabaena sp. M090S1SP1A06QC]MCA6624400.1 MltA domain-containing protein [Pseudanabaena sp. M165S2SP1A06QC]